MRKKITVDGICVSFAAKGAKITVKPLPKNPGVVLIEGDRLAFEFLAKLFAAHAEATNGCGFELGPKYAGNALFSRKAKLGLYLHRLPCDPEAQAKSLARSPSLKARKTGR